MDKQTLASIISAINLKSSVNYIRYSFEVK
jgi:hypothetical protein